MSKKPVSRRRKAPTKKNANVVDSQSEQSVVPYDENLLERARTQWQFGDWESLAGLKRENLQQHPDRAKLALLAAAGHLQMDQIEDARRYIRIALDWKVSKKLISQMSRQARPEAF